MVTDTSRPYFVCKHITASVSASETVTPNAEHAVTITVTILSSPPGDRDTIPESMPESSVYGPRPIDF